MFRHHHDHLCALSLRRFSTREVSLFSFCIQLVIHMTVWKHSWPGFHRRCVGMSLSLLEVFSRPCVSAAFASAIMCVCSRVHIGDAGISRRFAAFIALPFSSSAGIYSAVFRGSLDLLFSIFQDVSVQQGLLLMGTTCFQWLCLPLYKRVLLNIPLLEDKK